MCTLYTQNHYLIIFITMTEIQSKMSYKDKMYIAGQTAKGQVDCLTEYITETLEAENIPHNDADIKDIADNFISQAIRDELDYVDDNKSN